jgi:UDP-N-acetylglucosamine acyltransferase
LHKIHPTAIISPEAHLGKDIEIGPYAVIEGRVSIGDGSYVGPHAVIKGPTTIGKNCRVYQFASVGEIPQDLKFKGEETTLVIGDGNVIREYVTINRGTVGGGGVTRIGKGNFLMSYVHVAHEQMLHSLQSEYRL